MTEFGRRLLRGFERVIDFAALLGGVAGLAMFAVITYDVFMRYFLTRPTRWAVDVAELLMLPMVYLPSAAVLRAGGHVRVDLVVRNISGRARVALELFLYALSLIFVTVVAWQGWVIFFDFARRGRTSQIGDLPVAPAAVFIAIGATLLFIETLVRIGATVAELRRPPPANAPATVDELQDEFQKEAF
ncbi:MAG: TRAP transporter small permease [Dehalococcoidia bacterium]